MSHTPGPWRISRESNGHAYISSPCDIGNDEWWEFASVVTKVEGRVDKIGKANAAFIVKACNLHEELVEALKGLLPYLTISEGHGCYNNAIINAIIAIAKAEAAK